MRGTCGLGSRHLYVAAPACRYGMIQLVRFMYGEAQYDTYANNQHM